MLQGLRQPERVSVEEEECRGLGMGRMRWRYLVPWQPTVVLPNNTYSCLLLAFRRHWNVLAGLCPNPFKIDFCVLDGEFWPGSPSPPTTPIQLDILFSL